MEIRPVCNGCDTGALSIMEAEATSISRVLAALISPFPSKGRPSGSTILPKRLSPTGTLISLPVVLTRIPCEIEPSSSSTTAPTSFSSRLSAIAEAPFSMDSTSKYFALPRPLTFMMPSPEYITSPTSAISFVSLASSTCFLRRPAMFLMSNCAIKNLISKIV